MSTKHRPRHRRPSWKADSAPVTIRVGSRGSTKRYHELQAFGARDAGRFARLVDDQVRAYPKDPLVISINAFQPWLGDVIHSCISECWSEIADLDRAVQYGNTMQFPEKASKRGKYVPWTFIVDHVNVPQVYYWSIGIDPPWLGDSNTPMLESSRIRTGVWYCGRGACSLDRQIPVTIIFTRPTAVCEHIVMNLLFDYLLQDDEFDQPRQDEEGICWTFSRLHYLITDWPNIINEILARLDEAEQNSYARHDPVKVRTRRMHMEVDRIYEQKKYLQFQLRAFKKLQRLQSNIPNNEQNDPLWDDMTDAIEDLEQFDNTLDGLKDRFNNLIELEFNITNTAQADHTAFLTGVASLFLPVSFLATIFGMTNITWPAMNFLYSSIPVFIASVAFTVIYPMTRRRIQLFFYPIEERKLCLRRSQFRMLGNDLPDDINSPNASSEGRYAQQRKARFPSRSRSPWSRSRSRKGREKDGLSYA